MELFELCGVSDLAPLLELIVAADAVDGAGWVADEAALRAALARPGLLPPGRRTILAREGQVPVGYVRLAGEELPGGEILWRCFGTVHPAHRQRGLGTALVRRAMALARAHTPAARASRFRIPARRSVAGVYELCESLSMAEASRFVVLVLPPERAVAEPRWPKGIVVDDFSDPEDRAAYRLAFDRAFPERPLSETALVSDLAEPSSVRLLARDSTGAVVGFCVTTVEEGLAGVIDYLGVVPSARRRGLGRALLLEGIRRLRAEGYAAVRLATEVTNVRALSLYEGIGFSAWRESRNYEIRLQ